MDWDPEVGHYSNEAATKSLWKYRYTDSHTTIPSFSFDGTGYRLVAQDGRDIIGIYIPASPADAPCVHFRMSLQYRRPLVIGLHKGCGVNDGGPALRFSYGWGNDASANFINGRDLRRPVNSGMLFDEETSCCLARKSPGEVHVFEFLGR